MIVQELFGAESASQVYAQITEWMATLPDEKLRKVKWLLYDDMCHLGEEFNNGNFLFGFNVKGPFSQRKENVQNPIGKFFASRNLAVDFLHFLNHKDAKCQEVFNPYVKELFPVNSVICEQKFARSNTYSNCKSMNGPRFNHFFIYVFDLNNLRNLGHVRTLANPLSKKRLEAILEEKIFMNEKQSDQKLDNDFVDEVSVHFYEEDTCNCSRKSKCSTNKCSCFKNNLKCKPFCHPEATFNCQNH